MAVSHLSLQHVIIISLYQQFHTHLPILLLGTRLTNHTVEFRNFLEHIRNLAHSI